MRWKLFAFLLLVVALAVAGGVGWYHLNQYRTTQKVARGLELAKSQIRQGNHPRAQANLELLLQEYPGIEHADGIWVMLAHSYELTGTTDKALRCWRMVRDNHPDSIHVPEALGAIADAHFEDGDLDEAERLWDILLTNYVGSDATDNARFGKARLLYEDGEVVAARDELIELHEEYPDSDLRAKMEELLGEVNTELLFSPAQIGQDQVYAVKRGDTLDSIARRFKVSPDLLVRANRVRSERNLPVGKRLKIPSVNFSIVVDKSDNTLVLLNDGRFFKRYPVRTGSERYLTPTGEFRILAKLVDPVWRNPHDGKTYPGGHAENELGTRWMAFQGSMLGIHGTIHPDTIGKYTSNGCVGMFMKDVEELYDLVPMGTPVKIVGKMKARRERERERTQE